MFEVTFAASELQSRDLRSVPDVVRDQITQKLLLEHTGPWAGFQAPEQTREDSGEVETNLEERRT